MSNTWQDIVGHEWAVQLLAGAIEHGRIGHAYLITGPEQVGKTTLARTFTQALNCQAEVEKPCGRCRACTLIAADRHPDVRLVEPELSGRGKQTLKIDAIRNLQHELSLATYEARYKVAILSDFDAATNSAANAFLKTLEEPPNNVVLLLTAKDADSLLPTITSRCRTIALRPIAAPILDAALQTRWQIPPDEAHSLAHLADGRPGWALRASQDPKLLETRQERLEQLYEALAGNRVARFALADVLARRPEKVPEILRNWLSWWRDLTLLAHGNAEGAGSDPSITNIDQRAYLERMSRTWDLKEVVASFQQTASALWQLDHNANTRLALENLLLVYPYQIS